MNKNNKKVKKINGFDSVLLDQLMKDYDPSNPSMLIGRDGLLNDLKKALIERAMKAELDIHLGYKKNQPALADNYRNGCSSKTVITDEDKITIDVPRDRESSFQPQIVKKSQRTFNGFNDKIISMYARGMTVSEIQGHIEEIYGVEVSGDFISNVTDQIIEEVESWQSRALDKVYPVIFLDCIVIKCKEDNRVINKAVYLALAINMDGSKEILGFWIAGNEGAKFWLSIVTELKNRGIQDVFIFCVDGLKGLPEAINSVYPKSQIQLCIVHIVRNSLKFVPFKDRKQVATDLKRIYTAINEDEARKELNYFKDKWDAKYPTIYDSWNRHWVEIIPFLSYPADIRKAIYTTNAIESVNFTLRKIIKNKQLFPNDLAIKKILYLALKNITKKWTMPIPNWKPALNQFAIIFADRFPDNF